MNRKSMNVKAILYSLFVVLVVLIMGLGYAGNYFYNLALNPTSEKGFLDYDPDHGEIVLASAKTADNGRLPNLDGEKWFDETEHELWSLVSEDGLKLQGYYHMPEQSTDKWVVIVHGYMSEARNMGSDVKMFVDKGYNALSVDLRGHGQSEGDYIGMGWDDRLDMLDWIDQIISRQAESQIVLFGVSMGGATVMMTSGEELPSQVRAIIEDCGYTSAKDEFIYHLKRLYNLPSFPIMNASGVITQMRAGYSIEDVSALEQISKNKTPTLFIHGDQDAFVPVDMVYELYEAAQSEKELLIVKGAGHAMSSSAGNVYWDKVWQFMNTYLE